MKVRVGIAAVLLGLTATACSPTGEAAPAGATSTVPPASTATTTAPVQPLSVLWVRRLQVMALDPCRENPFATSCMTKVLELQTAVIELTGEADRRGDQLVKAEAVRVTADLQRYVDQCVTSKPGTPERTGCLTLLMQLPNTHEDLVAAIYESEQK